MPEGPEVRIITEWLRKHLKDKYLFSVNHDSKSKYRDIGILNHNELRSVLPLKIINVSCKGKVIILSLDKNIYITSQMGMSGRWQKDQSNHTNLWIKYGVILNNIHFASTLYFDDTRHHGHFNIYMNFNDLYQDKLSKFGIDLLALSIGSFDNHINPILNIVDVQNKWKLELNNKRIQNKEIWDFLLNDQHRFCGIGNYLQAEILYSAKIHPLRKLCELSENDQNKLLQCTINIIYESYQYGGLTIQDFWDPEGREGTYPHKIYQKEKDPNGKTVYTLKRKGRTLHFVPEVQIL